VRGKRWKIYRFVLKMFPNLALKPIDEGCAERASDLRAACQQAQLGNPLGTVDGASGGPGIIYYV
jgi:hypothetical protein